MVIPTNPDPSKTERQPYTQRILWDAPYFSRFVVQTLGLTILWTHLINLQTNQAHLPATKPKTINFGTQYPEV